ncbi:Protein of unknown function [Alteromonadaceae bacterium Bs31]|nr:Protein of unknown function [Alteromonadaceae bacterium Bs31]
MKPALVLISLFICVNLVAEEHPQIAESRKITADFQKALGKKLKQTLQEGGALQAIAVCSEQAPGIAAELSTKSGAEVGRISEKARNGSNAAGPAEREVLAQFAQALKDEKPVLEYFTVENLDKAYSAVYMKGIVAQPLCLSCHGETVAPEISKAIKKRYPADKATGYKQGDLRGAFVVKWPKGL